MARARSSARADLPLAVGPAINTARFAATAVSGTEMSVLCLIANPQDPQFDPALAAAIHREIGGEINWLHLGIACEIAAPTAPDPAAIARALLAEAPVDVALVPSAGRRKKLLIADMDSTMIEQECIDELADAIGIKPEIAAITERAMRGELDFEAALKTRVALLKGLPRTRIEEVRREAITLTPGGRALVQTMKAYGAYTALISGGFTFFADYFARRIGFDEATANTLEFEGEALAGTVALPIVDRGIKLARLKALEKEKGLWSDETLAVGDGANDLDMIRAAGLGVAFHAKPAVAAAADVRIDHGDLTALLYLQGYSDDEIVR
jgi:phosphoserine phosphatase